MNNDDRWLILIEDYLPIQAISKEASRQKVVLWWARRPLVACRAVVYGALVPASRFRPANGPEEKRNSLARANAAKSPENLGRSGSVKRKVPAARFFEIPAEAVMFVGRSVEERS